MVTTKELKDKIIVGLDEKIILCNEDNSCEEVVGRIDSGADLSSIDKALVHRLSLGPVIGTRLIKSASGTYRRDEIRTKVIIKGKEFINKFNVADRTKLKYKVLIGQDILKQGFLIDPSIKRIIK